MWQEIIVGICVLAAGYVVLRQWLPIGGKKSSGCGGCGAANESCASNNSCATTNNDSPSQPPK